MTRTTLDQTPPAAMAKKAKGTEPKNERDRGMRAWLPVLSWTVMLRLLVLMADYLIAFTTATYLIPELAVWLHMQSGVELGTMTDASIALWLLPLASVVALLVVGEIVLMRGLWRLATYRIDSVKGVKDEADGASAPEETRRSRKSPNGTNDRKRGK